MKLQPYWSGGCAGFLQQGEMSCAGSLLQRQTMGQVRGICALNVQVGVVLWYFISQENRNAVGMSS